MADELVPENDPILTTRCTDWDFNNPLRNAEELITCMTEVMHIEGGIGLSANQIGVNARLFIMEFDGVATPYFNPTIVQASEEIVLATEGCLSFPELELKVKRPAWLSVSYQTLSGNEAHEIMTSIKARCYSHEMDHLNGIRFTDRVSKLTADMARKRRSKLQRNSNVGR